ncbi:MAG: SDR family NAD(P)-dependent oxidoreductase, partial [Chthoniobacterales bacterium]
MTTKKIALVTGANKGIGLETVRQLAGKEMTVLLGARDMKKGEEAAEKLRKEKLDVRALEIDVSNSESIRKAAQEVEREFGRLDILINN